MKPIQQQYPFGRDRWGAVPSRLRDVQALAMCAKLDDRRPGSTPREREVLSIWFVVC